MKGLVAETTHGDLDLSFGSVIQCSWFRAMVIGVRDKSLHIDAIVLGPAPGVPSHMIVSGPTILLWLEIDDYEQVS